MANATYSTSLTGLAQGTTYEYRITAIGDGTTYANSATTSASTFKTLTKCATPTVTLTRNTSSFTASWSAVTGATGYTIRYKLSTASSWTTATTTTTSKTITGLTSGATYYVQVMATTTNASYVDSDWSTQQSVVIQTKLATPGSPSITDTTTSSITFGWSTVTNATSYTVYYKLSSATSWSSTTTTSTSWTKSSLTEGVTYQFKVKATNPSNTNYVESDETTAVSGTTKTTLATPTGLAISRTTNSLTASWSQVTNNSGYTLQYKLSTASSWTTVTRTTNQNSYTLSGLSEGKTYQFKVKAVGSGNYVDSAYCTAVSATTKITLVTPTGLTASNVLSTTATLSWNAVTNATNYWLDIVDSGGNPAAGGAYSGIYVTGTSINLADLDEHTQYTVSLVAHSSSDAYVDSSAATLDFTTDTKLAKPNAPTLTKTTSYIEASWNTISAADSYKIAWKKGTGSWTYVDDITTTSWRLTTIEEGASYTFKVQAITTNDAYESSDWSNESTTTSLIMLNTPTNLTATDVTINSATIGWTGDDRATKFKIEYRASNSSTWTTKEVDA